MNKFRLIIYSFFFCFIGVQLRAQLPDGSLGTLNYIQEIKKNYSDENAINFDINNPDISALITIRAHIIADVNGNTRITKSDVINSLIVVNGYFKNIGLQFFVDSIDYINDYNYSLITYNKNKKELVTKHAVNNIINLFLVDTIKMGSLYSYGFTYFPIVTDSNFIFIKKSYFSGNSLSTMLGHFFGLLSTHEILGGHELVNESNCNKSGDFICDTYADPDLFNLVVGNCKYNGQLQDSIGKYYVPSMANIMSNSSDACKCVFTPLQYRRMYYYYKKYRQYLK